MIPVAISKTVLCNTFPITGKRENAKKVYPAMKSKNGQNGMRQTLAVGH